MAGPRTRVPFRRRREGRTDYRTRLALLKSRTTRLVVRRTANNTVVQFVEFSAVGDRVAATANAQELRELGWKGHCGNLPAAYLAGLLAGMRAKRADRAQAILDLGHQHPAPGTSVYAALKGVLDAGVEVPHGEQILPGENRLAGSHVSEDVAGNFNEVKAKIMKEGGP